MKNLKDYNLKHTRYNMSAVSCGGAVEVLGGGCLNMPAVSCLQ